MDRIILPIIDRVWLNDRLLFLGLALFFAFVFYRSLGLGEFKTL